MAPSDEDRALVRRRHAARVDLLKRRIAVASVLGFATLFGLAAQHVVRGASAGKAAAAPSARSSATAVHRSFFDEQGDGFAFDNSGATLPQTALPPAAPVAQTSVS